MGIRTALDVMRWRSHLPSMPPTEIGSPWADTSHLDPVVWADILGAEYLPLTRAEAMRVPALARARHNLCPTIARLPLRVFRGEELVTPQPTWPSRTDGPVAPFHRMLWTIDDILFYGWCLWAVERGADGFPLRVGRVPMDMWSFDSDGYLIDADGERIPEGEAILIPGPHEGVLTFGGPAIRHAADLLRAASQAAKTPSANTELHQTNDAPMNHEDISALVNSWAAARRGDHGGVAYTPNSIEVKEHGSLDAHLLTEGRNAAAVDVARIVGQPATMVDAITASAGLEYNTGETRNAEFLDYGLAAYMGAVTARLSMDDVVPTGRRVAFDAEQLLGPIPGPTGAVTDD